ncbi:MAG: NTP transferase domain-containing protein [Chloroflexaceae bacterium]|nr:NTP transferase domain-containing protein [Chloroflexaceae bacterium]NJL33415.1 NTP transferase domain-containing protein [Chloroflexaceae bacterium]NJO84136.1 NTP transferase domain-containing protein [Blastochloris sp.]
MNVIVLTAGLGTRLRPHTYSKPKPLVNVAGKPMLGHILDTIQTLAIEQLVCVTGYLGHRIEEFVTANYNFPTRFIEQTQLLGQAHAIHLTRNVVSGPTLIVFGDGIFSADLEPLNRPGHDGTIFVREVEDPRRFGVVEVQNGVITRLVEKPDTPISNLAVIGVYYVPEANRLYEAISYIIEHNIQTKGEYYLADALQVMIDGGEVFRPETVDVWMDCGNPDALLATNRYLLENGRGYNGSVKRSIIIPPVYISESAQIEHSVIGPYVSVAAGARIKDSRITDSIINTRATIHSSILTGSLIGDDAYVEGEFQKLNVGDSSVLRFG